MDRILVVEDEQAMREIIRDYLAAHGMECDLARDGQEALDLLRDHDYDAVALDVLMPRLDGFGVCRAVRKDSAVPILFLTALGGEEDVLRGYAKTCRPGGAAGQAPGPHPPQPGRTAVGGALLRGHLGGHRLPALYGGGAGAEAVPPGI